MKNTIVNTCSVIAIVGISYLLGGCNSDSDSTVANDNTDSQEVKTGIFVDSPVSGLHYETDTLSGETNSSGEFRYYEGENVVFSIGDIIFGEAMGQSTITPLDLVPESKNDPYHPTVANMVRFMLTIDSDGDSNNGIQISSTLREGAQNRFFHFDVSTSEFENNSDVLTFIAQMTNISQLMDFEMAMSHFQETLDSMRTGNMGDTRVGIFLDGPVDGLHYQTDTISGITNEKGEFHYMEGEMVTFSVGDTMFGQIMGQSTITPLDLVSNAESVSHPTVTNMVRFMLTLDSDNDSTNGIHINGITRGMAYEHSFDFDISISDFESNPEWLAFVNQMPHTSHMVGIEEAQGHFQETLEHMESDMENNNMGMSD